MREVINHLQMHLSLYVHEMGVSHILYMQYTVSTVFIANMLSPSCRLYISTTYLPQMLLVGAINLARYKAVSLKPLFLQNRERIIQWAEPRSLRRTKKTKMDNELTYPG